MIDIIIPAYNAHDTIEKSLMSISMQTIKEKLNVYIIDDKGIIRTILIYPSLTISPRKPTIIIKARTIAALLLVDILTALVSGSESICSLRACFLYL